MEATSRSQLRPGVRVAVIGLVVLVLAVTGYFALGMPGMDHSGGSVADMEHGGSDDPVALGPQAFADRIDVPEAFVVNVHVPVARDLAGTDARVPYDEVVDDESMPAAKDTPLLLYCETGRMSAIAGRDLIAAGYTDVSHLDGGMEAWRRAGRPLEEG